MEGNIKYKCLIVDDEPIARKILNNYVGQIVFLENVAELKNAIEALEIITKNPDIDIVFLDINMPNLSGLALAKIIKNKQIIFTTAYEQHAVESYELNVVDYLLKPFLFDRFTTAVLKAIDRIQKNETFRKSEANEIMPVNKETTTIFIKSEGVRMPIELKDIIYCEAMKNYTKVFLESGKCIISILPLTKMEEELVLHSADFLRCHRSFIVSRQHIKGIKAKSILLINAEIPIGAVYRDSFLHDMGLTKT